MRVRYTVAKAFMRDVIIESGVQCPELLNA